MANLQTCAACVLLVSGVRPRYFYQSLYKGAGCCWPLFCGGVFPATNYCTPVQWAPRSSACAMGGLGPGGPPLTCRGERGDRIGDRADKDGGRAAWQASVPSSSGLVLALSLPGSPLRYSPPW